YYTGSYALAYPGSIPAGLALSGDGTKAFVTGLSFGGPPCCGGTGNDYATVSYVVATGTQRWASRYDGGNGDDYAYGLAVPPDAARVFVTGDSPPSTGSASFLTVGYRC